LGEQCTTNIPHELKLAIGRYEANSTVAVEFAQFNALMELAIINLDGVRRLSILVESKKERKYAC